MGRSMSALMIFGAILAVVGLVALAMPVFQTQETHNVANIGPVHVQATENREHVIPPSSAVAFSSSARCSSARASGKDVDRSERPGVMTGPGLP